MSAVERLTAAATELRRCAPQWHDGRGLALVADLLDEIASQGGLDPDETYMPSIAAAALALADVIARPLGVSPETNGEQK